jgi:hypothetical protein
MTRYSGDLPVRRWSRGRFAFRRAAVAPLVCTDLHLVVPHVQREPPLRVVTLLSASGPGDVPRRADVHGVTRESAEKKAAGTRCGPSSADRFRLCASREFSWFAPPGAGTASAVTDVSVGSSSTQDLHGA